MAGFDATFGDVSFDGRCSRNGLRPLVLGALGLATISGVAVFLLNARHAAAPNIVMVPPAAEPSAAPAAEIAANSFGAMIIEPGWIAKPASPDRDRSTQPGAEAAGPAPAPPIAQPETAPPLPPTRDVARLDDSSPLPPRAPDAAPPAPSAATALPEIVPLPPARAVPEIADTAPLPPPRPAELGAPPPAAPERSAAREPFRAARPAAPVDNRNFFQKLFGLGLPSRPAVASTAPQGRGASVAPQSRVAYAAPETRAAFEAPEGRMGGRSIFAAFMPAPQSRTAGRPLFGFSSPIAGFDRYTAVYDISARTVYLPDGTRLEAHSGYGDRLDDPRYVSERMVGPTPPNVYELTPREASFHGVDALRLNPIGDGPLYGRAGLLAHPYMLGPNGDSNGCVSFRDYDAFLRAYRNGQVRKLVVVSRL